MNTYLAYKIHYSYEFKMWRTLSSILLLLPVVLHITIDAVSLRCYDKSFNTYEDVCLDNPIRLLNSACFNCTRETVFYTFGFGGEATGLSVETIVKAYLNKTNILLLNWEKEASDIFGSLSYITAVAAAKKIGVRFGQALIKLFEAGYLEHSHLIGFSLGGPLMGYAAREYQSSGQNISRLTALDTARPLYDGAISLRGPDAASATFVMIIHTNPEELGSEECKGHVDVWPNCGNSIQPGCTGDGFGVRSPQNMCSHNRSWIYFGEALARPNTFITRLATSCDAWKANAGTNYTVSLDNVDIRTRGNLYLNTNFKSFYGRGVAGSNPQ